MKGSIACRILFSLFALFVPGGLRSQIWEDFSDGNFNNGVHWFGDTMDFVVNNGVLQLNAAGSDTSLLACAGIPSADTMEWRVRLKLDFAPSAYNYARYYLCSDDSNLASSLSAYYLQFGEAGSSDAIELFHQSTAATTLLARATDSMIAVPFEVRVKVLRKPPGIWELWVDYTGGESFVLEATASDTSLPAGIYTGWKCIYTSSNATKFFLDDVYAGSVVYDTIPPELISAEMISDSCIRIKISEACDSISVYATHHYFVDGWSHPVLITNDPGTANTYFLYYPSSSFGTLNYRLSVSALKDLYGNVNADTVSFVLFRQFAPEVSDLVFTEIMADPYSAPSLPPFEYVEIYNRSQKVILTNNFELSDLSATVTLPPDTLLPGEYRCYTTVTAIPYFDLLGYAGIKGLNNMPSLNNEGDRIRLRDAGGNLLDVLQYDKAMYLDPLFDDGGWSLERRDETFPCADRANWTASRHPSGGTPGYRNSVAASFTDTVAPWPVHAFPEDSVTIKVYFSEYPDSLSSGNTTFYLINKGIGYAGSVKCSPDSSCVILTLNSHLRRGEIYTLYLDSRIQDCSGNSIRRWHQLRLAMPDSVQPGDILLNEILFNPYQDGSDFVELYNAGTNCIDLSALRLARSDPETGISDNVLPVCEEHRLFLPGDFAVVTDQISDIQNRYRVTDLRMLMAHELPSFNDDEGIVVLLNSSLTELERFHYKDDFHFPLLADPEGVSLERISYSVPANDSSNWHSAAENAGYASPCAVNTHAYDHNLLDQRRLNLSPELFSPDNDGYHDVLGISCRSSRPGFMVSLTVYNEFGIPVRKLTQQEMVGTEAFWIWDGCSDFGELQEAGIYVIILEMYHIDGEKRMEKKVAVLAKAM